jgi:prevent-host-death family protein
MIYNIISQCRRGDLNMSETIATATSTEMQNNFGRYLHIVMNGGEVIVTKNGKEVGRFIPRNAAVSYLTDSLTGILKESTEMDLAKAERLKARYESAD